MEACTSICGDLSLAVGIYLCVRVLQTALAQRNQELQVMVDQAASRPQTGHADATAPFMRVDLREETVTEKAQPGVLLPLHLVFMSCHTHPLPCIVAAAPVWHVWAAAFCRRPPQSTGS